MTATLFGQVRAARARAAQHARLRPAGRTMVLRSQADANAAANRPGYITRSTTTMTNTATIERPTVTLSCHHTITWAGQDDPQPGDKAACFKCPPAKDQTPKQRTVKTIKFPAAAPAIAKVLADVDTADAPSAPEKPAEDASRDLVADVVTAVLAEAIPDQPAVGVIEFPDRQARMTAAKAAARTVRDKGGTPKQAGKASDTVMATPVAKPAPADTDGKAKRTSRPEGEVTGLKLSGPRTKALQLAVIPGQASVTTAQAPAAEAIRVATVDGSDAKRVSLDAHGVRVLLDNLPRIQGDEQLPQSVRAAAGKALAWLTKFTDQAG